MHHCGSNWQNKSPAENKAGVAVGTRVRESLLLLCAAQPAGRGSCYTPPPDTLTRLYLEFYAYLEKDGKELEKVQKRARGTVRFLEHAAYKERFRSSDLVW